MILFNNIELIPKGKRLASIYEASLKVLGRTKYWKEILGIGYKVEILNSLGESYVDKESYEKIFDVLNNKTIKDAQVYIKELYILRDNLTEEIKIDPSKDFTKDFAIMMGYFFAIKSIFETIYSKSNIEDQKIIENWRNDPNIFEPLELYYKIYPEKEELNIKEWSWVYINDSMHFEEKVISFSNKPETSNIREIKGNVAYPGFVKGKIKVVLSQKDKESVEDGDVIVAPMTTVDFLPIMKKASAFVTNEGGITSHAAIVARELKKPCIIGTKIATKVLKNGMEVEVDATNGIVKIIKY